MPSQEDIKQQIQLLRAHRSRLNHYLLQRAELGKGYAPPGVTQGIADARAEIARCKSVLRGWGEIVEDHPDDEEQLPPAQVSLPASAKSQTARVTLLIEGDVEQFSPEEQAGFTFLLSRVVNVSPEDIRIVQIMAGSIKVTLEMPAYSVEKLVALYIAADSSLEPLHILRIVSLPESKIVEQIVNELPGSLRRNIGRPAIAEQPDQVTTIALRCQELYAAWQRAMEPAEQASYAETYRHSLEALWEELAPDLGRAARGWIRSGVAPDIEKLAMNMFSYIVFKLPSITLDNHEDTRSLLLTVARRAMSEDYQHRDASSSRRRPNPTVSFDEQIDLADEARLGVENDAIQNINSESILSAVDKYWNTLDEVDRQIMRLRWRTDPPISFREIAQQLGPGWAEDAVRQRHHRIINATRKQLRERRLDDSTED